MKQPDDHDEMAQARGPLAPGELEGVVDPGARVRFVHLARPGSLGAPPGPIVVALPDTGHLSALEQPDAFGAALLTFAR